MMSYRFCKGGHKNVGEHIGLPLLLLLAGCILAGCSLTGDITPLPGYQSPVAVLPTSSTVVLSPGTPQATESLPAVQETLTSAVAISETPTVVTSNVNLKGKVVHGAGSPLPAGLQAVLQRFDNANGQTEKIASTDVQSDGSFTFNGVGVSTGQVFYVTVTYKQRDFMSDILQAADLQAGSTTPLTITLYETSQDISALTIEHAHIFLDFTQSDSFQVLEIFIITNSGDRMVVPASADQPLIQFSLPDNASGLQFDQGMDPYFVTAANKVGYIGSVQPGVQTQILFSYFLPYQPKATGIFDSPHQDFSLSTSLPVTSAVVMLPESGIQLKSSQLQAAGSRTMGNMNVRLYTSGSLAAGSNLVLSLSGSSTGASLLDQSPVISFALGVGVFIIILAAGLWSYRRMRRPQPVIQPRPVAGDGLDTREALLDAIIALDDAYQAGALSKEAYQKRRGELKDILRDLQSK